MIPVSRICGWPVAFFEVGCALIVIWYLLIGLVAALVLASLAVSTPRRVWAFHLHASKYLVLWFLDFIRLRPLWLRIAGRPHVKLTRPVAMRLFCEDMGPTFIKFGQIVASSAGLFPDRYVEEFRKCLDQVRPFPFAEVRRILRSELGQEQANQLIDIDPAPLASASVAQVHTAKLADGTEVVIKVQRPNIQQRLEADMRIMRLLAIIVSNLRKDARLANPVGVIEDFAETLAEEIDFRREADNLNRFNEIMRELGYTDIRAPVPHSAYTTRRVLVMERFYGIGVDQVEEIRKRELDAEADLVRGLRAWFQCVLFYGFFHGDVHAGNLMLLEDGDIGFLDFGIVGRFDDRQRRLVTDYIVAFSTGDYKRLAEVICEMGGVPSNFDREGFADALKDAYSPLLTQAFSEINYAELVPTIHKVASEHEMTMPKEFVLITKQMLYFDRYAKLLAPKLNIFTDPRLIMSLMTDIQKARAQQADGA